MQPGMIAAAVSKKAAISVSSNWGSNSAATSTITSATRTMSAPPGSVLLFTIGTTDGAVTAQYQLNGGTFTTFTSGATLAIAHGDTLAFRVTGAGSVGNGYSATITNNVGGASVGSVSFNRT